MDKIFDDLDSFWITHKAMVNLKTLNNVFIKDDDTIKIIKELTDYGIILDNTLNIDVANELLSYGYVACVYNEEEINNTIVISKDRKHLLIPIPVTE